ncbi:MAG TPA: glycosyltransferase family 9 protein [Tepidisphaeraceae bacterium]|jgi:ADP-heptose:LPS heptosyltransferase
MLRRNVLIFHNAALGDFIMTWPLAVALGRVLAQSRIIYVTASQKGQLAERVLSVESIDAEAGWHGLLAETPSLPEQALKLVKGLQTAVVFSQSPDVRIPINIHAIAGDNVPVLQLSPNPPPGVSVWEHQLLQLQHAPMIRNAVEQVHKIIRERGLGPKLPGNGAVVIHPGSGAARKNWNYRRFIGIAMLLHEAKRDVVFALGEVERETFGANGMAFLSDIADVKFCDTLLDLHALIVSADAYVGNDSGPTHLAAVLGRNTVAMFGPTSDIVAWSPQGPRVTVLPFEATSDEVIAALT